MHSPKIIEDVRTNNKGEVKLKDITLEVKERKQNENIKQLSPPHTNRTINIFTIIIQLTHRLFTYNLIPSILSLSSRTTTSVAKMVYYYIIHFILMILFLLIAIYKNFLFIYRKICLKYLTLIYYHNKSPQVIREDVNKLDKIPKSISCILDLKDADDENGGKDGLINQISELSAWCISSGISKLIIYEYTGTLNQNSDSLFDLNKFIIKNLKTYFGSESIPTFSIRIPHKNLILYSDESLSISNAATSDAVNGTAIDNNNNNNVNGRTSVDLEIDLLSRIDGKPTLVELTKTMSELAQNKELSVNDITIELIDEELIELVGPEPDLLISFGPSLNLEDYPPWHIRLSEIYWEPENKDVNYAVFIRALKKFSNCKVNVGK
ncbi:uncharacterized protein KGF55_004249 [Candida pseudojiufengensis]|uniref:uncharacterized protein n=1 Tax=Candida pseudojiufengensis TaxID=497109 RepID=UPI0022250354|nr:uncharacterized protein KGF55_004249 [Candida pseudojiufengensis]KAI5960982.1 hypothetical protein KGF55_004249 [Candida pseudojiufengensis]